MATSSNLTKTQLEGQLTRLQDLCDELLEVNETLRANKNELVEDLRLAGKECYLLHGLIDAIIASADGSRRWGVPRKTRKAIDAARRWFIEGAAVEGREGLNDVDLGTDDDEPGADAYDELDTWERDLLDSAREVDR